MLLLVQLLLSRLVDLLDLVRQSLLLLPSVLLDLVRLSLLCHLVDLLGLVHQLRP